MADDKMQSDIVQQRKDALHQQLRENQKDIGLTQEQVNDIKIQEQVDATILSKLHSSNKNDQNTLDEIADVQGRLKRDKDTEHKLESSDLALEKKRLTHLQAILQVFNGLDSIPDISRLYPHQ